MLTEENIELLLDYCQLKEESVELMDRLSPGLMIELINRMRQAEMDAARYRLLRDSANEFDINDFFTLSQESEKRDAFSDEAMQ